MQFGVSERRACRVVDQPRSTQRLPAPVPGDEELALRAFLRDFSRRRPRWGWRRAAVAAKTAGWRVNHKRIHRLWIAEGLRVPYTKRKKPLRGIGQPVGPMCPIRPNVVWGAMDFQFDQTSEQNPWVESYGSRMRDDSSPSSNSTACSRPKSLSPIGEASTTPTVRIRTRRWGMLAPAVFAERWRTNQLQLT